MSNFLTSRRQESEWLSVSQLTNQLKDVLESEFPDVRVEGEITGFSEPPSGHVYFTLKDAGSVVSAVIWKTTRQRLKLKLANGMKVQARGGIVVYGPRGSYQLQVASIQEAGEGDLWAKFQKVKERLEKEGLFSESRKRPLPQFPSTIGVVTSPSGAVIRDILTVLQRRAPGMSLLLHPARVQGLGAAQEIARGVRALAASGRVDLIIVARGGGSMEDLWEFNDEALARTIAACPIPVVSAVGHETDFTIADFVADRRAPTPSAAAEIVSAGYMDLRERVVRSVQRIDRATRGRVRDERRRVQSLLASYALRRPELRLREVQQRFDDAMQRLPKLVRLRAERLRGRLDRSRAALEGHDPLLILKKGYAIVRDGEGRVVTRAAAVAVPGAIELQLNDGRIAAVTQARISGGHDADTSSRRPAP